MQAKEYDDRTVIAVVKIDEASIGCIVDTVTEVKDIPESNIDPPPSFQQNGVKNRYIHGLGKTEDQVVILLDLEKLISGKDLEAMRAQEQ
jgi:purine-binding chemotaxis protein CheW